MKKKQLLLVLTVAAALCTLLLSSALPAAASDPWTADLMGTDELPAEYEENPEGACYVDGFAMIYTTSFTGDHFSYADGKLTVLDDTILRYNWFFVLAPTVEQNVYEVTAAGNNLVSAGGEFTNTLEMDTDDLLLVFDYWEGDGRIKNKPYYDAYNYVLGGMTVNNGVMNALAQLWIRVDDRNLTVTFSDEGFGSILPDDPSTDDSSAESAASEPASGAESKTESKTESKAESKTESKAESATPSRTESKTAPAPTDSSDGGGFPTWGIILIAVAAAAVIAAVILVIVRKKK